MKTVDEKEWRHEEVREITAGDLLELLRRHLRMLTVGAMLGAIVGLTYALIMPRTYTSTGSFFPKAKSNVSGIAAQFGLPVPQGEGDESPAFYSDLLTSRTILSEAADSMYPLVSGKSVTRRRIADLYNLKRKGTRSEQQEASIQKLRNMISVTRNRETGVVTVSVAGPSPEVSQAIAKNLFALVSDFNVHTRQSHASQERAFAQQRWGEAQAALRQAEEALASFTEANRIVSGSAELGIARDRLVRQVGSRQQLANTLEQQYEQARIEEVRDIPVINIVDLPNFPVKGDGRRAIQASILCGILAIVAIIAFLSLRGIIRALRRQEVSTAGAADLSRRGSASRIDRDGGTVDTIAS